ncbi:MAG: ribosome-associated translation inhibitor RaiA [Spirochaetales bacterium]|nr:ribosome-associated translation inhibitor RaiA [Leptospiraceae bacterium]MCP5480756.1 ribosome-associated translation inhibitor RaiA [Spirochaetales bacterium]
MDISYHWHNVEQSDAIEDYTNKKIQKLADHFSSLMSAVVRFKVEKLDQFVELAIDADGHQFIASERDHDLYAAIDLAEEKLEKQIRRHKEKHLSKRHRPRNP